ncbi:hypothetical protein TCAL_15715 [Tigriopus californicus]|uniref:Ig-like domain-containing protein n=1 Tax=Tigriopus californicus TaxID=6832 RepID=A0A553P6S3_TIGCA|nr:hypothetical protein TCAL_15715 [Tigriopus californicus]
MKAFFALASLAVASAAPRADNPAPYQPAPYKPAPYQPASYKEPSYDEPPKYQYNYAVADEYSGVNFNQNEGRDVLHRRRCHRRCCAAPIADQPDPPMLLTYAPSTYAPATYKPAPYQPAPYKPAPYKPLLTRSLLMMSPPSTNQLRLCRVNFNQNEARDGYAPTASTVWFSDGRTQIVTYTVQDAYSGYALMCHMKRGSIPQVRAQAILQAAPKYAPPRLQAAPAYEA